MGHAKRGRPRDAKRDEDILEATFALLGAVGLDRLRIQDVATRAHVGLATIYRRWPTKAALLDDTMQRYLADVVVRPPSDDPANDLAALLSGLAAMLSSAEPELVPGMVAALRREPDSAATIHRTLLRPLRDQVRTTLQRLNGDPDPSLELRADMGIAVLIYRAAILGSPMSDVEVEKLLLPQLTAGLQTPSHLGRKAPRGRAPIQRRNR